MVGEGALRVALTMPAAGEATDFVRLVQPELPGAYRLAGYLLRDATEAEDATQDALEKAWQAWPKLRETDRFSAWFDRIVVNVCNDRLRHRRGIRVLELDEEIAGVPHARDPFREALARDEVGRLNSNTAGRPADRRRASLLARPFARGHRRSTPAAARHGEVETPLRNENAPRGARPAGSGGTAMTFHEDPDLERRIRSIADSPQPPVPGSVLRYAGEVTHQKRGFKMRFSPGGSLGRGPVHLASVLGVAATLVVAVALAGVLISERSHQTGPSGSNSPSTSASGSMKPTSSASAVVATQTPHVSIPAGTPRPTLTNVGFETPGVASGWQGFPWTTLAANSPMIANPDLAGSGVREVLNWQGGYAATGSSSGNAASAGLWLSPDGQTWTPVNIGLTEPTVMVAVAPIGLVVIGVDASGTPQSVWTTSDGRNWNGSTGVSNLPGSLVSIAGTSTGIVATVAVTTGTGKFAPTNYFVEYSTDGEHWSPETIQPGLSWNANAPAPMVQSNSGRFFLLGSTTTPLAQVGGTGIVFASSTSPSYVWWSDNGRTWTRSGGSFQAAPQLIDFGRDGMLLETSWNAVPGGTELARSTDGGKTWSPDAKFGPLGPATCTVQCSTGPDGVIGANGTYFVAVKNGGKQAWTSLDGAVWTPIAWAGPDPATVGLGSFVVLPRGVLVGDVYGAAR